MNCPLPPNLLVPRFLNALQITHLNFTIIQRVYMDFTNMADVQMNLTQKEEELAEKERTIRELNEQLREVHRDKACYIRLLDDERTR